MIRSAPTARPAAACTARKKGKAPTSGTMRNGRLVIKRSRNDNKPRGDNKRLGRHNGWG